MSKNNQNQQDQNQHNQVQENQMQEKPENQDQEYLRHSAAHLLAAAVLELWPDTKRAIGPAIEDGFYYDFEFSQPISETDLPQIEAKMLEILPSWHGFERQEVSAEEAKHLHADNQYKHELIDEFAAEGQALSIYRSGEFSDLCRGGHVDNPAQALQHFKLLSVAGAYWRGSEKNPMLTRIYGTVWSSQQELEDYLKRQEEAKQRDHRKLGQELDLFVFSDTIGKGLPLFTPKGATVRRELERYVVDEELKRGYLHVYTPDIAHLDLYRKSGHYPYYQDTMYAPITIDDEEYMLRPMTCPHHFELFSAKPRSYREMPMRLAELAKLYRYEQSGALTGLLRVRSFCLADAHIICRRTQAQDEINGVLDLIDDIARVFGLKPGENYHYRLSLGDRANEEKYYKDDEAWDFAEDVLRRVLQQRDAQFVEATDEAAFYGPKIDVQMKNVNGKEDSAFTVQYDFVMPKRFDLSFINESGEKEEPVVVHRSSIGAVERTMAFLIEHYAGAFPLWLAPVQAKILPVSDKFLDYSHEVRQQLEQAGIRVELDDRAERLQAKIRDAQLEKVPYMLVIGGQEAENQTVTVRRREGGEQEVLGVAEFIQQTIQKITARS
jgi:threonyl-tRNA synthetase